MGKTRKHQRGGAACRAKLAKIQKLSAPSTDTASDSSTATQSGGRKHSRTHKRGGFGSAIHKALVPFTLFTAQKSYGRKRKQSGGKTHKKRRAHKRHRHHRRHKAGFGSTLRKALVPFGLFAAQKSYRRRK